MYTRKVQERAPVIMQTMMKMMIGATKTSNLKNRQKIQNPAQKEEIEREEEIINNIP